MTNAHQYPHIVLDRAASALHAIGRSNPDASAPLTRIECLVAAEQLRTAGARVVRRDISTDTIEHTLRQTLIDLGALPDNIFGRPEVLEAARAARNALRVHTQ